MTIAIQTLSATEPDYRKKPKERAAWRRLDAGGYKCSRMKVFLHCVKFSATLSIYFFDHVVKLVSFGGKMS